MNVKNINRQAQTETDMHAVAADLAACITPGIVIYLHGSLGAGKTTFVRGFLRALNYNDKVKSPTYTLVEPYHTKKGDVFHFDLYRLKSPEELLQIGLEEYFTPTSICLIEWPDKGGKHLPEADIAGYFDILEQNQDELSSLRAVRFEALTKRGEEILARL